MFLSPPTQTFGSLAVSALICSPDSLYISFSGCLVYEPDAAAENKVYIYIYSHFTYVHYSALYILHFVLDPRLHFIVCTVTCTQGSKVQSIKQSVCYVHVQYGTR